MIAAFLDGGANDAVTAILAIALAAVLRALWNIQSRVARLEGIDEGMERALDLDRERARDEAEAATDGDEPGGA